MKDLVSIDIYFKIIETLTMKFHLTASCNNHENGSVEFKYVYKIAILDDRNKPLQFSIF